MRPRRTSRTPGLAAVNPVKKIPTLVTDDGAVLYDSGVITDYLNDLGGHKVMPAGGAARWTAKRREALADGLKDAAVLCRYETFVRPADKQWDGWLAAQMGKVDAALDAMNAEVADLGDPAAAETNLGAIAFGCALGYLDFRFADKDWRSGRPALAGWYETYAEAPGDAGDRAHCVGARDGCVGARDGCLTGARPGA